MESPARRQKRLVELAIEVGVPQECPRTSLPVRPTISATPEDVDFAQEALNRTRSAKFESKKRLLRRTPSKAKPKAREATETLEDLLIERTCSAGRAEALIRNGADANFSRHRSGSILKRIRGKDQEDIRSNLFQRAIEQGNAALIDTLARKADAQSLNEGLGVALRKGDIEAMKIVMGAGADPNLCDQQFHDAVRDGKIEIVAVLSSGSKPPTETMTTSALTHAVSSGQLRILSLLLWHGADSNDNGGSAFFQAAQLKRRDQIAAFCLAKKPPSPALLAQATSRVYTSEDTQSADSIPLIETLLAAGASGGELSALLVRATKSQNYQLVDLLVHYTAYDQSHSTEAMKHALVTGDARLFQTLIKTGYGSHVWDTLLSYSLRTRLSVPHDVRFSMMKTLVRSGATEQSISIALIDASAHDELDVARFLVDQGASADYNNGESLKNAINHRSTSLLAIILSGNPSHGTLVSAFQVGCSLTDADSRFEIMELLLTTGVRGDSVHQALIDAMKGDSFNRDRFARLLLQRGEASVNFKAGEAVRRAVRQRDISVFMLLIENLSSMEILDRAFTDSLALKKSDARLQICEILLKKGLQDLTINEALVAAVRMDECDLSLVDLIISFDPSTDFDSGNALRASIVKQNCALLSLLLSRPVQPETLCKVLTEALCIENEDKKFELVTKLLDLGPQITSDDLGELLHQTFANSKDSRTLQLFLSYGSSISSNEAAALKKAVAMEHLTALELMFQFSPPATATRQAFAHAWAMPEPGRLQLLENIVESEERRSVIDVSAYLLKALRESPRSHALVSFLLRKQALIEYSNSQCLLEAVADLDYEILKVLLASAKNRQGVSNAFAKVIREDTTWHSAAGLACLRLLLENGASGSILDEAMLKAVTNYFSGDVAPLALDELIRHNASPNFENGRTLEIAAEIADPTLLEKLLNCGPTITTATKAFRYLLMSGADDEAILFQMDLFWQNFGGTINLNAAHDKLPPILFLCMQQRPNSVLIFEKLLQNGASVSQELEHQSAERLETEAVNTLLWAIQRGANDAIVELLINFGADVNFVSSLGNTPLLAAARCSRSDAVRMLLERDADVSVRDFQKRSALFYASRNGDVVCMRQLIDAGAPPDDGSIQEAARNGSVMAVQFLLEAGHDANYPSTLHSMRGCLEELVTQMPHKPNQPHKLKATVEALVKGGANPRIQRDGKSLLILALDIADALAMTTALLSAFMYEYVNEDFNKFRRNGYVYSPLSYVIEGMNKSNSNLKPALVQILQSYGCKEIYYCEDGPQPANFTGAPSHLVQEERRRRDRLKRLAEDEEDAEIARQRRRDDAADTQRLEQQFHALRMRQDEERAIAHRESERQRHVDEEHFAQHKRTAEINQQRALDSQRLSTTRQDNQLQLEFKQASALQDQSVIDAKLNAERQVQEMRRITVQGEERVTAANHTRTMKEIEARKAGMKQQVYLLDKQKEIAQLTNSMQQRQISYDPLD